ncbi:hypothetical protein BM523_06520 [Alteromonas mediterranea]|uniref:hypothetical protein n=1 Tax=Alteromonas mediterranea TaxID=314275 RepID=UPI0009044229|nr:hypothetical protein [Alteromonas mediterranea]APD93685.1 hypothetical protein BM523_06520 [Alteromonas mediterranea]APD97310.1 hypothetical protein BM525_06570 [Alteromonas mediterranea]
MTVQFSQGFSNQCPLVSLKGYSLYYIWQGHLFDEGEKHFYQLKSTPDPEKVEVISACWDGYAGSYQLNAEGRLILTQFHYFLPDGLGESDALLEELHGDFYLEFRTHFEGDQLYVPFVDGNVIIDREQWVEIKRTRVDSKANNNNLFAWLKRVVPSRMFD